MQKIYMCVLFVCHSLSRYSLCTVLCEFFLAPSTLLVASTMKHSYHTYFLISHFCSIQLLYNNYKLLYSKLLKTYNILCSNINGLYKYMMLHINSWHSISMDSSSLHSTKYRSNLLKNNYLYRAQTCFLRIGLSLHKMKVIYHDLKVYRMIDITYMKILPYFIWHLNIHRFWYTRKVLKSNPPWIP